MCTAFLYKDLPSFKAEYFPMEDDFLKTRYLLLEANLSLSHQDKDTSLVLSRFMYVSENLDFFNQKEYFPTLFIFKSEAVMKNICHKTGPLVGS